MIPPTSIDGTDITGATIDGTDVQEITVDGDVVFSAEQLPVRFSDMVGWWPFDPAQYGGAALDDVTAIIGGSADDTAFDGSGVNSPTHQTSGGADDINAGASSGYMDLTGSNDIIEYADSSGNFPNIENFQGFTMCLWFNLRGDANSQLFGNYEPSGQTNQYIHILQVSDNEIRFVHDDGSTTSTQVTVPSNTWVHAAITHDYSGNYVYYVDGSVEDSGNSGKNNFDDGKEFYSGQYFDSSRDGDFYIDDCRIYDQQLSSSDINQIYQNTDPN